MMERIKSILSSASGRRVGPPVPPRPPPGAIQKALEKTRNQSTNFPQPTVPIAKGRTVIYTSTSNNSTNGHHVDHQQHQQQVNICENKCFDTKFNESSTGLKVTMPAPTATTTLLQNGNIASTRVYEANASTVANIIDVNKIINRDLSSHNNNNNNSNNKNNNNNNSIIHNKSNPVPRPRLKTPPLPARPSLTQTDPKKQQQQHQILTTTTELNRHQQQQEKDISNSNNSSSSYTRLLMQNQNTTSTHIDCGLMRSGKIDQNANRDDELKEKLLAEIFSGRLIETSNVHLRYNNKSNLKRSSSCDVLNDRNSIIEKPQNDEKLKDRKVVFHEMLISELSEMRRVGNDTNHRLSMAKSCSDLSPNGHKQMTIIDMRDDVKINNGRNKISTCLISLEDSGVEDEEKPDDCSSSGVGDSWDSCKEMQNR